MKRDELDRTEILSAYLLWLVAIAIWAGIQFLNVDLEVKMALGVLAGAACGVVQSFLAGFREWCVVMGFAVLTMFVMLLLGCSAPTPPSEPEPPVVCPQRVIDDAEWIHDEQRVILEDYDRLSELAREALPADVNGDGVVNGEDIAAVLTAWGECSPGAPCPADVNGDGVVDGRDMAAVLAAFGWCWTGGWNDGGNWMEPTPIRPPCGVGALPGSSTEFPTDWPAGEMRMVWQHKRDSAGELVYWTGHDPATGAPVPRPHYLIRYLWDRADDAHAWAELHR